MPPAPQYKHSQFILNQQGVGLVTSPEAKLFVDVFTCQVSAVDTKLKQGSVTAHLLGVGYVLVTEGIQGLEKYADI